MILMCEIHQDSKLCSGSKWKVKIKTDSYEDSKIIYCEQAMVKMFGENILHTKELIVSAKKMGR